MRWTALVSKTLVAGAAGVFLAVSAARVETPPASDADPGREVPAEHRTDAPDRGPGPGGDAVGPGTPAPTATPTSTAAAASTPSAGPSGS
ncbi:hypothetical protein [Streptomyces sp. NPDC051180]|uniref:hypothetical protein n=1 Tax=unclassified Streptomyces TaxID=2593676 RepID=UPI00344C9C72